MKKARFALLAWLLMTAPYAMHAQGCSLCKDTTAGSAPKARQGLRRAILVLGIPAGTIFLGILLIARRIQPNEIERGSAAPDSASNEARS